MLGDLIARARTAAPAAFEAGSFAWPPPELVEDGKLDIPWGQTQPMDWPGGTVVIRGEVDDGHDAYGDLVLKTRGLDTLAWYRSFHFGESGWGIYITEAGVRRVASALAGDADLAFAVLWAHEYFHFLSDIAATFIEAESGRAAYLPHHRLVRQVPAALGHAGWCHISEAMANAYALDNLEVRTRIPEIKRWMRRGQPAGYSDGPSYSRSALGPGGKGASDRGRRELMWHLFGSTGQASQSAPDPSPALLDLAHWLADDRAVPWFWVSDRRQLRPDSVPLMANAHVDTTPTFERQIAKLGLWADWEKARDLLARDAQHPGLHFKKLKGSGTVFSVRLGRDYRGLLRLSPHGTLVAEKADKRSDVYR